MAEKQAQLNGAYYGPSIPPQKSYHRPGRGGGLDCCCGCICSLICRLVMTVIVIVGIAALVFWLIVRPNKVKFHVTDASLTQFDYTNNTLHYNLALNITIRNPNRRLGIYYDSIEARGLYEDARFHSEYLTPFYMGHKTTHVLTTEFKGQQVLSLNADHTEEFNKDKTDGVYDIDVKMYLKIRFKLGVFKTGKFKPKINCDLKLPLTTANGTSSSAAFQTTSCDLDY
ncbi:NDR1/HIN1-like protein 10 [Senna tora]|uniref:NDR1/HIN1-like protein 10 n=1 Tax=Senna tora TaxID=362788 RepID=A0A834SIM0_9FABA|nr:NDR1/HIN1-like protein 10 [Senna tora]